MNENREREERRRYTGKLKKGKLMEKK